MDTFVSTFWGTVHDSERSLFRESQVNLWSGLEGGSGRGVEHFYLEA